MEIEIEIPKMIIGSNEPPIYEDNSNKNNLRETFNSNFSELPYRWVIVSLMGISLLLNGIANNAVIPLQHKMTVIYGVSPAKVSISIILSFLVFSIVNFPANGIIDSKGLRVSFLIGTGFFTIGTFFYALVNHSYNFVVIGTLFMGIGQPFLMNCPAKVAAFWFFPKNRALATAIMVGINLFGMGVGFLIPTLAVNQQSTGEDAKIQIGKLYIGYFIFSSICFLLNWFFMKSSPQISPSEGASAEKLSSSIQSLKHIKNDSNLWKFFLAYFMCYGTFIAFASNSNFIIKPYGYTDIQIAVNAILLMVIGTLGAIVFSIYIKKTFNYRMTLKVISIGSITMLGLLCLWLNTYNFKIITTLIISCMGFLLTPIVPICYELGCELAFPLGQAQITGLLNGGALLWAFISSTFITNFMGFGSKKQSLSAMLVLSLFIFSGSILFFCIKILLKRHEYENKMKQNKSKQFSQQSKIQNALTEATKQSNRYTQLNQQGDINIL